MADQSPHLIEGGLSVDERGTVTFVNDFQFEGVKRFYTVANHERGFVRGWHGHRYEAKYVTVLRGAALIGVVELENWETPAREAVVQRFVLSATQPSILYIPPGYANSSRTLTDEALLMYFSTATLAESQADHLRYDPDYWPIESTGAHG